MDLWVAGEHFLWQSEQNMVASDRGLLPCATLFRWGSLGATLHAVIPAVAESCKLVVVVRVRALAITRRKLCVACTTEVFSPNVNDVPEFPESLGDNFCDAVLGGHRRQNCITCVDTRDPGGRCGWCW